MKPRIVFRIILHSFLFFFIAGEEKVRFSDDFETRARLMTLDRNVIFHAGFNKNITFLNFENGKVYFNNNLSDSLTHYADFLIYSKKAQNLTELAHANQQHFNIIAYLTKYHLERRAYSIKNTHFEITKKLEQFGNFKKNYSKLSEKNYGLLKILENRLLTLNVDLFKNQCTSDECINGGTCIPRSGAEALCLCPPQYAGYFCEDDVDECLEREQCENNGTCVNTIGGFECKCLSNFHGPKCEFSMSTCSKSHNLCGPHGTCIDQDTKYDCHCHPGFQKSSDLNNPFCVDVNECLTNPCLPGVHCNNLDGSYQCFGCPKGYRMGDDGCIDINECEKTNACFEGVTCRNLPGSYECDSCPPGTSGDSKTKCEKINPCDSRPCDLNLLCVENIHSMTNDGYDCICENGIDGGGFCVKDEICSSETCSKHGKCAVLNETNYKCYCDENYSGENCETLSPCASVNCKNGQCVLRENIPHCKCNNYFYGESCENHETDYDEHFTELSGLFEHQVNQKGVYLIKNMYFHIDQPNTVLKINFDSFSGFTQNSTGCHEASSRILLYDGPNENYPLMKNWCGEPPDGPTIGQNITFTTTHALMKYEGYEGVFWGNYVVVPSECGYRTQKPGHLLVPGYKKDIICEWFISAPINNVIEITVPKIFMDSSKCEDNKLEIHDGIANSFDATIAEICKNSTVVQKFTSTGPYLTVSFSALSSEFHEKTGGFTMKYIFKQQEKDYSCGAIIENQKQTGWFGYIESPNFGSLYPPNSECDWKIIGGDLDLKRTDVEIQLTIEYLDIPSEIETIYGSEVVQLHSIVHDEGSYQSPRTTKAIHCFTDKLQIFTEDRKKFYQELCQKKENEVLVVESSKVNLEFRTNKTVQGKGFRLRYDVLCQKTFDGNGTFETWNFGRKMQAETCVYIIKTHMLHITNVLFTSILMNTDCNDENPKNYVEIETFAYGKAPIRYTCKNETFQENTLIQVQSHEKFRIKVVSDGSDKFKGVAFKFYRSETKCGGLIDNNFQSPLYPDNYPAFIYCKFIVVPKSSRNFVTYLITFDDFDLPYSCEHGNLTIKRSLAGTEKLENYITLCGNTIIPSPLIVLTKYLSFEFSTSNVLKRGFKGRVETLEYTSTCNRTYHRERGLILRTGLEKECTYKIAVDHGQKIVLGIRKMNIPCSTSSFEVIEGSNSNNSFDLCNEKRKRNIEYYRLFSNEATIHFKTTDPENISYWLLYTVMAGCGSTLEAYQGIVAAPQYPRKENREVKCDWRIGVSRGNKINFTIISVDELSGYPDEKCESGVANSLEITENIDLKRKTHGLFCHRTSKMPSIISETNHIDIKYIQDPKLNQKVSGFYIEYTTYCKNIEISKSHGVIQSPGFEDEESYEEQDCSWNIKVPMGNRIRVSFVKFDVDRIDTESEECVDNFLKIDEVHFMNATIETSQGFTQTSKIHKYCDLFVPREVISRHNQMRISYQSALKQSNKFMLHYEALGCVEEIYTSKRILVLRNDIDDEYERFECQYHIKANPNQRITVLIDSFDVKHNENCINLPQDTFTGVKIFLGSSNSSGHPKYHPCAVTSQTEYDLHTNEGFIQVLMNRNSFKYNQQVFLNASIVIKEKTSDDRNGEVIDLSTQPHHTIMSQNYPNIYDSSIRSEWLLKPADGYNVKLKILNFTRPFATENHHCDKDYMTGKLTISSKYKRSQRCDVSDDILSHDVTKVIFEGADWKENDGHKQEAGFVLKVEQICGTMTYAESEEKTIHLDLVENETCMIGVSQWGDNGVFGSLEVIEEVANNSLIGNFDDKFSLEVDGKYMSLSSKSLKHVIHFQAFRYVFIRAINIRTRTKAIIRYRNSQLDCNRPMTREYSFFTYTLDHSKECVWILNNTLGNTVSLTISSENFPNSPHCTDSFIEIRETSSIGKLRYRKCEPNFKETFEATSLYIRFKYTHDTMNIKKYSIDLEMSKIPGGETDSRILLPPVIESPQKFSWQISCGRHFEIKTFDVVLSHGSYIKLSQLDDDSESEIADGKILTGFPGNEKFEFQVEKMNIEVFMKPKDDFKFEWSCSRRYIHWDMPRETEKYHCGEDLTPTWDWQSFTNPLPPNQTTGIITDEECQWKIQPSQFSFSQIEMKFEYLDMFSTLQCWFDWVKIYAGQEWPKETLCYSRDLSKTYTYDQNKNVAIHFHAERTTENDKPLKGFKLLYRLKCGVNSADISSPDGSYEYSISSPPWRNDEDNVNCEWNLGSSKNRKINVTIENLQMEICEGDNYLMFDDFTINKTYCEQVSNDNKISFITSFNKIKIKYFSENQENLGFNLTIKEAATECPGDIIHITEDHPRGIWSPEYPKYIPPSSSCAYIISAPNGHRVMLTFKEFEMEEKVDKEFSDYIQVRDGPSERSKILGTYSGKELPSSIFSTGNFMFMRLHTGKDSKSPRFMAMFEVAKCGGTLSLSKNNEKEELKLMSPTNFEPGTECEWVIRSPNQRLVAFKIESLPNDEFCQNNNIVISSRGNTHYNGSGCLDTKGPYDNFLAVSSKINVVFNSRNTTAKPKHPAFIIKFRLSVDACGEKITKHSGSIKFPHHNEKILPHLNCEWNFKSDPGNVWKLDLEFFDDKRTNIFSSENCYKDLQIIDYVDEASSSQTIFCENKTSFISSTDSFKILYDDHFTRSLIGSNGYSPLFDYYARFRIIYEQIPRDTFNSSCTYLVTEDSSWKFGTNSTVNFGRFCHLSIPKSEEFPTILVNFTRFEDSMQWNWCKKTMAHLIVRTPSFESLYCKSTFRENNNNVMLFNNENLDLLIGSPNYNNFEIELSISFLKCGGYITEPMYSQISNPKAGPCQWIFEAPVGQFVQITVSNIDCGTYGELTIGEGKEFHLNVIHKYCDDMNIDEEHFKIITSKSRFLTIVWKLDKTADGKEKSDGNRETTWKLEYEFVNENDVCGFSAKGMSGVIHTNNYGVSDYQSNQNCDWFIHVPVGYYVRLHYTFFDIEKSDKCEKDGLYITQQFANKDQSNPPICGHENPVDFNSKTRNLKISFKSDGENNGRGFHLEWRAVCGGVFEGDEGIITSPNYPDLSKNVNTDNCYYEIKSDELIELNFDDFDLMMTYSYRSRGQFGMMHYPDFNDPLNDMYEETNFCSESVQIFADNFHSGRMCNSQNTFENNHAIVKGPVKIILENKSYSFSRGFKLSYKKLDCNKNIHLSENTTLSTLIKRPNIGKHHFECNWNITTTPGRDLVVYYEKFYTAPECNKDYVKFDSRASVYMGNICGDVKRFRNDHFIVYSNDLTIKTVYNYVSEEYAKKSIVELAILSTPHCGFAELAEENNWKTITPPKSSTGIGYSSNLHCDWEISAYQGQQLRIRINSMDMKQSENCDIDRLTILEGHMIESSFKILENVCGGLKLPYDIVLSSNAIVQFNSKNGGDGVGLNISYIAEKAECGGSLELYETQKTLKLDYKKLKNSKKCLYVITTYYEQILVKFSKHQIRANCEKNYIEIHDAEPFSQCADRTCFERNKNRHNYKFCASDKIPPLISNRQQIQITVHLEKIEDAGFGIEFSYSGFFQCNRTINLIDFPSGRLTNPNFPHAYNTSKICTTKLENSTSPQDTSKLLIIFETVLGDSEKMIEFNEEGKNSTQFAGDSNYRPVFTNGGATVDMVLKIKKIAEGLGFDLSYYSVIKETENTTEYARNHELSGVLSNQYLPKNPEKHIFIIEPPKSLDCEFKIKRETYLDYDFCKDATNLKIDKYIDNKKHDDSRTFPEGCFKKESVILLNKSEFSRYLRFEFFWNEKVQSAYRITWNCNNL